MGEVKPNGPEEKVWWTEKREDTELHICWTLECQPSDPPTLGCYLPL